MKPSQKNFFIKFILFIIIILSPSITNCGFSPMNIKFEINNTESIDKNYRPKFTKLFEKISILFQSLINMQISLERLQILSTKKMGNALKCIKHKFSGKVTNKNLNKINYGIKIYTLFTNLKGNVPLQMKVCDDVNDNPVTMLLKINNEKQWLKGIFSNKEKKNFLKLEIIKLIIRNIISEKSLKNRKIYTNINLNENFLEKYNYYNSFKKFFRLSNNPLVKNIKEKTPKKKEIYYLNEWENYKNLNDILIKNLAKSNGDITISEITLNLFNDFINYYSNKCDVVKFINKCFRFDNKCINETEIDNFFIQYTITSKNKVICYLNNQNNLKKKQCGNKIGNIIDKNYLDKRKYSFNYNFNPIKNSSNIKISTNELIETSLYKSQKLVLLNPSPKCPNKHPRTIYFFNEYENKNPFKINPYLYLSKNLNFTEVVLTDPKYFVVSFDHPRGYRGKPLKLNNIIEGTQSKGSYNIRLSTTFASFFEEKKKYKLNKYIKVARFPDGDTYKDGININYNKLKAKFPKDFTYIPETYLWPEQKEIILQKFSKYTYDPKDVWLFKPARDYGGHGVKIIDNYKDDLLNLTKQDQFKFLITRYIMNPLLINKRKFDLRAFVLVTGYSPLKVYFYRDGYIRITTKEYNIDKKYNRDNKIHITTTLLSNNEKSYIFEKNYWDDSANFWNYLLFEKYCKKMGIDYDNLRNQTKDFIIKTFISLRDSFDKLHKEKNLDDFNLFQLYAFDIIIDDNYKVYLLELNRLPTMEPDHISANNIYSHIVPDILNILGIFPFAHDDTEKPYDPVYNYTDHILEKVDDALCEFERPVGMFERVFPLKGNINNYRKYFSKNNKENELLWEKMLKN